MQTQVLAFENRIDLLSNFSNLTIFTNIATRFDKKGNQSFDNGEWRGGGGGRGRSYRDKPKCQVHI